MKTDSPMPVFRYSVQYVSAGNDRVTSLYACYMQEEGSLVVFKDAGHSVVFAVSTQALYAVERDEVPLQERKPVQE